MKNKTHFRIYHSKRTRKKQKRKNQKKKKKRTRISYEDIVAPRNSLKLKAPDHFCFLTNSDEITNYFSRIENAISKNQPIILDLRKVELIHPSACLLLRYLEMKANIKKVNLFGRMPQKAKIYNQFLNSGYFEVYDKDVVGEDRTSHFFKIKKNTMLVSFNQSVDAELAAKMIKKASAMIWGEERLCKGLQTVLLELMGNTVEHASGEDQRAAKWMLAINKLEEKNGVSFCFVDLGIGIFESLKRKNHLKEWNNKPNKWFGFWDGVKEILNIGQQIEMQIFEQIFSGEKNISSTGLGYRGKGLPGIAEQASRHNSISNLFILSNTAKAEPEFSKYSLLKSDFSGTFVYFELLESNANMAYTFT